MGHSILNIEGITALVFLFALLLRPRTSPTEFGPKHFASERSIMLMVALAAFAPYVWALSFPLVHDSYDLVYIANTQSWRETLHLFHAPGSTGDRFYRPAAFAFFWLYAKVAHFDPPRWHAFCIAGHAANSVLVYVLARRLRLGQLASGFAALLFAWHGSRPEAVAWVATRVDILATFFTLLALLAALRYVDTSRLWVLTLALVLSACAALSKESAYTLPLLFVCLLAWPQPAQFSGGPNRRRTVLTFAALTAVCAGLFTCRFFILGGMGGYQTSTGAATALNLNVVKTANALLYRQWAIAFFPINWSERDALIPIGLGAAGIAMIAALMGRPANRRALLLALAFMISAVLPAHHLLLIGADLNGARVLYLPLIGFALLWAVIVQSQRSAGVQVSIVAGLLVFQLCALTHNLKIWHEVAETSQRTCAAMAEEMVLSPSPVSIDRLPATRKGVFFLSNGFAPCVMMNSGGRLTTPPAITQETTGGKTPHYAWNEASGRIERVN